DSHQDDRACQPLFHLKSLVGCWGGRGQIQVQYISSHCNAGPTVYTEPKTSTRSAAPVAARAPSQPCPPESASVTLSEGRSNRCASWLAEPPRGPGSEHRNQ